MVAPADAPSKTRGRILFAGKLVLAAVLITWLIRSGSLDFKALDVFVDRPLLVLSSIGLTLLGVVTGALRWSVLLRLANVRIPFLRAMQLQATAIFFNVAIPGNVGGDLVKSGYAAREAKPAMRPTVFVIVFVERILGLGGLVLVAGIVILLRGPSLLANPQLRELAIAVAALATATVLGPGILVLLVRTSGDRLERWTSGPGKRVTGNVPRKRLRSRRTGLRRTRSMRLILEATFRTISIRVLKRLQILKSMTSPRLRIFYRSRVR